MSTVMTSHTASSAREAELKAALQWATDQPPPPDKSIWVWSWEAIQGDFNDNRSTGQIAFDAGISMIPLVDQVCDVRDIVANCSAIAQSKEEEDNTWKWVSLCLTLIGLFPVLGSLVKGVLKIFFVFIRRHGMDKVIKAVDDAMTWVIIYLRRRDVQKYLRAHKIDDVFQWLANKIREVKGQISASSLLANFDKAIRLLKDLLGKVSALPWVGERARQTIAMVESVRAKAQAPVEKALEPVRKCLDAILHRLEIEALVQRSGILDVRNVHFRGTLPEARAVTLMRTADPRPAWLSAGSQGKWTEAEVSRYKKTVNTKKAEGWPDLDDKNIRSFHKLDAVEIKGPAKLFRVVSPSNTAMGECWIPEDVWNKIQSSPDPKAAWRKYMAVWPDWNPNGQFVVMDIAPGDSLKVWRGPASSQKKKNLDNAHLEGGWDQIIFKPDPAQFDTTRYYMRGGGHGETLHPPGISRAEWEALSPAKQRAYTAMREQIKHPGIRGPLDTGWGSTDFDAQLRDAKIGLPALPGQVTK